jgi:hypothetical protein
MKTKLIIAGVGNIIDAVATSILTQYFGFFELNPIMAWLLQWPVFAMVSKVIIVTSILLFAYYTKRQQYMNIFATFAALLYGSMGIYYIVFFIILFS